MKRSEPVTPNEIAARLKVSPKTVRQRLRVHFGRQPGTWERWLLTPREAEEFIRAWKGGEVTSL
jgi:AraC-like DNA-binding protein